MPTYTQQQIDNFWWGTGGSPTNIKPGAYVLMNQNMVLSLTNPAMASYDAGFFAILAYPYREAVINKSGIGPTGADGFYSLSKIGGIPFAAWNNAGILNGPTKS